MSVIGKTVQLIHSIKRNVINEMKVESDAFGFHSSRNRPVFVGEIAENEHRLSVWIVENKGDSTHV